MITLTGPYDNMVHLWDLKTRRIRKGIVIRCAGVVVFTRWAIDGKQ